jgi:hypothetical protein
LRLHRPDGEWWFWDGCGRTHVRWTYTFQPRPGASALVRGAIAPLWKRYQRRALMLAIEEAARAAA